MILEHLTLWSTFNAYGFEVQDAQIDAIGVTLC
jgi:hypothetical protein